jgi:hypothetical protein
MNALSLNIRAYLRRAIVAVLLVALTATSSSAQWCGYLCVKAFGFILFQLDGTYVYTTCYSLPNMDGTTTIYCIYT